MWKKIILSSFAIILVPTILFGALYGLLYYTAKTDTVNYAEDVRGSWSAIQYYYEGKKIVCSEEKQIGLTITPERLCITGGILPEVDTEYEWSGGRAILFNYLGKEYFMPISFDAQGHLKIGLDDWGYTILFVKSEAE